MHAGSWRRTRPQIRAAVLLLATAAASPLSSQTDAAKPAVQSVVPTAAAPALASANANAAGLAWPQKKMQFNNAKPVLGLPLKNSRSMVRCATDNTAFFNLVGDSQTSDVAGAPRLYSISTEGEVKSLLRKLPLDFNDISVRDFFVSEQRVVTLVRATKSDDQGVHETRYFLSTLDTQGDFRDLVEVEGHFRPMKLAVFGSGEVLLLGWDEANLLPVLALLKENGTIRYFLDVTDRKAKGAFDPGGVSAALLEDAAFVAYGPEVLLTFPGTVNPVLELNATGVLGSIRLAIPAGYVLHDVLYSGGLRQPLVVRVQARKQGEKPGRYDEAQDPRRRLFEMSSSTGALIRELVPDKPKVLEVTCAGKASLTAVYYGTVIDSDQAPPAAGITPAAVATGAQVNSVDRAALVD